MTLDEAIIHAEEIADRCDVTDGDNECGKEHRQLAEWLKELRSRRETADAVLIEVIAKIRQKINDDINELLENSTAHSSDVRHNAIMIIEGLNTALRIVNEVMGT